MSLEERGVESFESFCCFWTKWCRAKYVQFCVRVKPDQYQAVKEWNPFRIQICIDNFMLFSAVIFVPTQYLFFSITSNLNSLFFDVWKSNLTWREVFWNIYEFPVSHWASLKNIFYIIPFFPDPISSSETFYHRVIASSKIMSRSRFARASLYLAFGVAVLSLIGWPQILTNFKLDNTDSQHFQKAKIHVKFLWKFSVRLLENFKRWLRWR